MFCSNVIRQYIGVHHKVLELLQSKPSLEQLPRSGQLFFIFRGNQCVPTWIIEGDGDSEKIVNNDLFQIAIQSYNWRLE